MGSWGNWSRGELVIALDRAGNQRREIESVEQISAAPDMPLFGSISCFDQQVQHAKENVGETQRKEGKLE